MESFKCELKAMGSLKFAEAVILVSLLMMVILWISRAGVGPGWESVFDNYVDDGTVAMFFAILLYIIPATRDGKQRVMDWEATKKLPWDIVLLLGSGFALAKAIVDSGTAKWIGESLKTFENVNQFLLVLLIVTIICYASELCSNVATANICLPILASLAISMNENPLLLMVPGTIASSLGFMLPIATPPNAMVFASGQIRMSDMMKMGFLLNFVGIGLTVVLMFTLGLKVYGITLEEKPDWAVE